MALAAVAALAAIARAEAAAIPPLAIRLAPAAISLWRVLSLASGAFAEVGGAEVAAGGGRATMGHIPCPDEPRKSTPRRTATFVELKHNIRTRFTLHA
ncbi:hypothetical protein [Caulobacter sp. X]|uniref:hypothetical protein n=1 Tax=Caulobacter sp. X TaxID=2048901 RepID=UPI001F2054A0|nr:hypothetical protein [Caulobacter sp. X]